MVPPSVTAVSSGTGRCQIGWPCNRPEETADDHREAVRRYYDAWQAKGGDFSDVPLAEDFEFTGPVASFDNAEGYRQMARQAGSAVTSFVVRRQLVDGGSVCSIIDWEMAVPGVGKLSAAEWLEVADGKIVRGELFYDGEELRRAMGT